MWFKVRSAKKKGYVLCLDCITLDEYPLGKELKSEEFDIIVFDEKTNKGVSHGKKHVVRKTKR